MPFHVVIPARYASERLPGKALADIAGRPMIHHVWERARESGAESVIVATDSDRVLKAAQAFGAEAVLTREDHASGTDRIAEVARSRGWSDETIVVNLQGDEPLMPPALIGRAASLLAEGGADIATLAAQLHDVHEFHDPNVVKVVVDEAGYALYFSRAPIPWPRSAAAEPGRVAPRHALRHLGLYAYRCGALARLVDAAPAELELTERLEQLRALHLGLRIRVGVAGQLPAPGVDTVADLERVRQILSERL
ncbi:3-deoxy-manno-octulosonate cytidylyltransferase [Lentisalinibacter sediminis]|uniref:3-deoxy-manno-octulosonate cytidylyltransferase n=1 Tax=Lentisalinibacter sediminis TaxID=2992237 RepID=UPI0038677C31